MAKDHWDAILASSPLNATAGAVTSRSKVDGPVGAKVTSAEWDAPPPYSVRPPSGTDNLIGHRFGRFTVIGWLDRHPKKGSRWLCRCTCGTYAARRSKSITNPENADIDRCTQCRHTAFLAKSASGGNARHRAESEKARKW